MKAKFHYAIWLEPASVPVMEFDFNGSAIRLLTVSVPCQDVSYTDHVDIRPVTRKD